MRGMGEGAVRLGVPRFFVADGLGGSLCCPYFLD